MKTCKLLFCGKGRNLEGFVIVRQFCVVSCFFVIARVTTLDVAEDEDYIFGFSDGLQAFFNTGLLGAIIIMIVGSISWQLWRRPSLSPSCLTLYLHLPPQLSGLKATGLCSGACAAIQKQITAYPNATRCTLELPRIVLLRLE